MALAANPGNRQYYEKQFNKFKKYMEQDTSRGGFSDEDKLDHGAQAI
jgi:hypothetical protein